MLSASQPSPSHLPARSRATLHHQQPCRDSGREKGRKVALIPGFAHQLCHFYISHPSIAASSMAWYPMVLPAHLGANRAPQIPSMLQPALAPQHPSCGKLSWKTHRNCCPWHLRGMHVIAASLKPQHTLQALTPQHRPQTLPTSATASSLQHPTCPQGWWHWAAEESVPTARQVLGTGAMGSSCPQTPAGKGIKQSPWHHPPIFPKSPATHCTPSLQTTRDPLPAAQPHPPVGFGS